jgi:5-methylcytosine-specific restriction protein A
MPVPQKKRLVMAKPRLKASCRSRIRPIVVERVRGRRLQQLRRRLLAHEPLCAECSTFDHPVVATQRDHVVPLWKGGPDVEGNVQGLCDGCHELKTSAEAAERMRVN